MLAGKSYVFACILQFLIKLDFVLNYKLILLSYSPCYLT